MRKISSVLPRVSMIIYFLSLAFFEQQIYSQQLPQDRYAFNGTVNAVEVGNNTLFVGGDFDMVGPSVQNLTMVDITTNQATLNLPTTDKGIYGIIPDNSGGWYVYGAFTMVGDSVRKSMAHILPDYSVDSWSVSLDGPVYTMLLHNGAIYFGGQFYEVNGIEQWLFAAVDTDGDLIDWDPGFYGNSIETMATDGSVMYFGGNFTQVGTQTRNRLAAIDLSTKELTSWNPNPNSGINTIEISDTIIYVGGAFTNISGMPHTGAAAIGKSGTLLDSWAVNVSGASSVVNCIKKYGSVIYLGGNFNKINGYDRTYAGAVDVSGNILNWAPIIDAVVYKIVPLGSSVLVGGDFTTVNGQKRSAIVQVDSNNGNTVMQLNANLGINPEGSFPGGSPKPVIRGMLLQNDNLILCGMMDIVGGKQRTRIAAIDLTTNELLDWAPQIQGTAGTSVSSLKYHNGIVFVGGNLIAVNEIPRKYLAAINYPSGDLLNWNPDPNNRVHSIKIVDTVVYIGGTFTTLGDGAVIRNYLAAISESGTVMDWNPNPDNTVYSIEVKDTALYFGGFFNSVSGETRNRLAAVTTSGNLLPWNPNASTGQVLTIAMCDTIFYVGGSFNGIGGNSTIRKFAAVDINGNLLVDRSFGGANNSVNTVKVLGNNLYVGGLFTFIGTNSRNRIAAINLQTNTLRDDWIVDANNPVNAFCIDATNKVVYVGGSFKLINTSRVLCLAPITDPTIPTQQILPFAPSDLIADADTFYVDLNWGDNSNNEDGFVIEKKEGDSLSVNPYEVIDSVDSNVTGYTDAGLTPNTTYTYRILAYNLVGNSPYSNLAQVTTLYLLPQAPTNLIAIADTHFVELSWDDNSENETGFKIERKDDSLHISSSWVLIDSVSTNVTSYVNTGLTSQTTYSYRVYAYNEFGNSSYSDSIEVETILPVELNSFTANVNGNTVNLNWSTASETNNRGFEVERKVGSRQSAVGNNVWEKVGYIEGNGTTTETKSYLFTDKNLLSGSYSYRLKQIDFNGTYSYTKEVEVEIGTPEEYSLEQNYPNPFNPSTKINYIIPEETFVTIKVYDVLGREVMTLVNEVKQAGKYEIEFRGEELSSGMYMYRMESGNFISTQKMLLLK